MTKLENLKNLKKHRSGPISLTVHGKHDAFAVFITKREANYLLNFAGDDQLETRRHPSGALMIERAD